MDKITQALKKILPAEHVDEVTQAVAALVAEEVSRLEAEFQKNLDKAYEQNAAELQEGEAKAEAGYKQAYEIIAHLMNKLDEQRQEFETALEEGFDEAYAENEKLKAEKENAEAEIYNEFDNKLQQMKDIMVDKLDQFMALQEAEMLESATQHVLADPRLMEQRVVVEKMAELLADHMSDDSFAGVSSAKLEEAHKQIEALKGQVRLLESKSLNLSMQKKRLEEKVGDAEAIIAEATKAERKERANRRGIVSGRGKRVVNDEVISEFVQPTAKTQADHSDQDLSEAHDPLNDLLVLSGLTEQN